MVLGVARRWAVREDQPWPGHGRPRACRSRRQPVGGDHRQPEREDERERRPRGYDAGKKINGRKRHALVDTDGRCLVVEPHPASVQDRDSGGPLLNLSRRPFPFIEKAFADSAYAGERVAHATVIAVEIVPKNPDQVGFAIQPRRWVVERFFAWINRNGRLAKDFEATIASARAFLYAASVMLLVRRLGRTS